MSTESVCTYGARAGATRATKRFMSSALLVFFELLAGGIIASNPSTSGGSTVPSSTIASSSMGASGACSLSWVAILVGLTNWVAVLVGLGSCTVCVLVMRHFSKGIAKEETRNIWS